MAGSAPTQTKEAHCKLEKKDMKPSFSTNEKKMLDEVVGQFNTW
ncbi:hypothetical protein NHJ13734_008140 [Beauveria thailandica]